VPDPSELLSVVRLLSNAGTTPPSDVQLRRAVSTTYYALFHKVLCVADERFMGPITGPGSLHSDILSTLRLSGARHTGRYDRRESSGFGLQDPIGLCRRVAVVADGGRADEIADGDRPLR
jgi:hypothetical protein